MKRDAICYVAAIAAGVAIWLGICAATGRREAWDARLYWIVGLPLAYAVAGLLAVVQPRNAWRWAVALFLAQFLAMVVLAKGGGMWPLGLLLLMVLAVPGVLLGNFIARRMARPDPPVAPSGE